MISTTILAQLQQEETPMYYYDLPLLRQTIATAKAQADRWGYHIHYAVKANFNPRILEEISASGMGADCVSGLEIEQAIAHGFQAEDIVFAGVGKTDRDIQTALEHGILAFNVESLQELKVIGALAQKMQTEARVALRINPNIDAQTHHYITTGLDENKFGIFMHELEDCLSFVQEKESRVTLVGLHFHVGSQISDWTVFKRLCLKVNEWNAWFVARGYVLPILNVGGGVGINYAQPDAEPIVDFAAFFSIFNQFLTPEKGQQVHFELGRSLVANCGSLISRVLYIKNGVNKNFAILDAGMTELLRPALYQAQHKIDSLTATQVSLEESVLYEVVGPICESSDCFGKNIQLPPLHRGDLIAIRSAGAYGEVMASRYNLRQPLNYYFKE
ncbi:diaminopimelate decarboxylase [Myroides sp. DF42-4-2]|uniref:diaminopimelate decarboxylase n=1 Tax=unclassified Myroides TaxID=2642485 RepID=UPI002578FBF5|nr:diaminopimelate decarboxylase [Myroides sp. DF42-4-2]MDM1407996.1 diaminopimelate decarboxylase [Myroides sp. DF42-4-2]